MAAVVMAIIPAQWLLMAPTATIQTLTLILAKPLSLLPLDLTVITIIIVMGQTAILTARKISINLCMTD